MTLPAGADGEAWIEVHADTDRVEPEIERGVRRAAEGAEGDLKKTGEGIGDALADGVSTDLESHGRDFQEAIERSTKGRVIKTKFGWRDTASGRFVRKIGDDIEGEVERAFKRVGRDGGPLSSFGQAIADAIGAGFNVSGKSPLIGILTVVIAAVIGLVLAAIQAVGALVAVLGTIPALIAAIGLQVAVVMIAFDGVGKAIQGAFDAKNAKELQEAIKGLTPAAQEFVKGILPAKQLFSDIKKIVQENFFLGLGDSVAKLIAVLGPLLRNNFGPLAAQMGKLFASLADFFASPQFVKFVEEVFPATIGFLARFGPAFVTFLQGLINVATVSMPFLTRIGEIISATFETVGYWLDSVTHNSDFLGWLRDMDDTLVSLQGLFFSVLNFFKTLFETVNEAGGVDAIDALTKAFNQLSFVLSSEVGKEGMKALIDFGVLGIQALFGIIEVILLVLASLRAFGLFITEEFPKYFMVGLSLLGDFFVWLGEQIVKIFDWVVDKVTDAAAWVIEQILKFYRLGKLHITNFLADIAALPGKILAALANFGSLLFNKGKALLEGLIAGIRSKFGELANIGSTIAGIIVSHLPGSPAEEGPLSGKGYALYRGQRMVHDFARGMKMEAPQLRETSSDMAQNIVFGPNSIRVGFEGVVPTPDQARITGSAAGQGILGQLAARNTRLAIRTL